MERIADVLFFAGHEVSEEEIVIAILARLQVEYDVIVALVSEKLQNADTDLSDQELIGPVISVQDVQAMELSHDMKRTTELFISD